MFSEISNSTRRSNESYASHIQSYNTANFEGIQIECCHQKPSAKVCRRDRAPFNIRNLDHLSVIFRRIDNARNRQQQSIPFSNFSSYERCFSRRFASNRYVKALENEHMYGAIPPLSTLNGCN